MSKILVVDDCLDIRDLIRVYLVREGYQFLEAADGREGVERAGEADPDVVIMDVMMPVMDGLEACRRIRANPSCGDAYVIMLSANCDTLDKGSVLDTGADAYLAKPFKPNELISLVQTGLRIREDRMNNLLRHQERMAG